MPKQVSTNLQTVVSQMTNPRDKLKFPQLETWYKSSDQALVQHELDLSHAHKRRKEKGGWRGYRLVSRSQTT
jgi:hypothetical protein